MGNILEEIAEKRKADIAVRKQKISPEEMRKKAETIAAAREVGEKAIEAIQNGEIEVVHDIEPPSMDRVRNY